MTMGRHILGIDQGTTGSRAVITGPSGAVVGSCAKEHRQYFPAPGWVEHDANEIWDNVLHVVRGALAATGLTAHDIAAIGITNQRETVVLWDRVTGEPLCPAIVWQCRRTSAECARMKADGMEGWVGSKTGLLLDPYFSGTKVSWALRNIPAVREAADRGRLAFGTIDSWLVWNLTGGRCHATDATNASRTLLYNIGALQWDTDLLELFRIPESVLPAVVDSVGVFAETHPDLFGRPIPITGMAGDQQAATFGQTCFNEGDAKNTYGTGCFLLLNTGGRMVPSTNRLLTTVCWMMGGKATYALEGSVFVAGAAVQWLRDGLGILAHSSESQALAEAVPDTGGVYFVPALTGLGAPYWDPDARGAIYGLTRGTDRRHIVRATLESMAYQTADLIEAMQADSGSCLTTLMIDGGASANGFLAQFQADILGVPVERPADVETTALGACYMAGLGVGLWDMADIRKHRRVSGVFTPSMDPETRARLLGGWKDAVSRTLGGR